VNDLHLASCLISAPAFIACAQGGNNCRQVRYPADPPNGAPVVGNGREVLALVELGPVTLEALPDGVVDGAGQGGAGLAVVCRNSTAARARSATLPQIVTTTRRLGPGGRARPGLGRVWACLVGDEGWVSRVEVEQARPPAMIRRQGRPSAAPVPRVGNLGEVAQQVTTLVGCASAAGASSRWATAGMWQ
jgi:hypothetical protein